MITRDILNFVFGYVEFSAADGFGERFINSCTAANIPLWDISKKENVLKAKTTCKGYLRIRNPARKSSMNIHMIKKVGLPFLLNRFLRRKGLVAGFIVAVFLLLFLSGRIWIIDVTGNEHITEHEVIEAFEEAGLTIGSSKRKIQLSQIESAAMLNLGNASWAAVNIRGCTAEINVRELKEIPDIEIHRGTANIVARKDGQIDTMEVYRGSAAVGIGQPVLEGELLVSGITESRLQTNLFTDAYGYVVAKTNINVQNATKNTITQYIPQEKKVWSLYFLGIEILPPKSNNEDHYEHRSRLVIKDKKLPFGINYRLYTTYTEKEKTMSEAQTKLMALTEYALESYHATLHTKIIEQDVVMSKNGNSFETKGKYFCYENIGKTVSFDIEETDDTQSSE